MYVAIVGSLVSGTFPATFYINKQPIGLPQQVVLRAGPTDFTRTLIAFQTPRPNASSITVGNSLTAVLRWADVFSNVEDLESALEVRLHTDSSSIFVWGINGVCCPHTEMPHSCSSIAA